MTRDVPNTDRPPADHLLRRDIRMLGFELGHVIRAHSGQELFDLIERVRELAKLRRRHERDDDSALRQLIASLSPELLDGLIRALSCFFDLANLAEDRHRIRVLRQREARVHPAPLRESIGAAIESMKESGMRAAEVQAVLARLQIELVFTAHPTEAKRRTVRRIIRRLREDVVTLDEAELLPREREALIRRMAADLACLWETDTLRPHRPSVAEEVRRGIYAAENLWDVVPHIYRSMREALRKHYGEFAFEYGPFLRFGSWIGGDRDGHPFVTAEVTRQTLLMLRKAALQRHVEACDQITGGMGISTRRHRVSAALQGAIAAARQRWPEANERIEKLSEYELYRHWLTVIRFRLERTVEADPFAGLPEGAYGSLEELQGELSLMRESLLDSGHDDLASAGLQDWLDRVRVFGFHLLELDVREDSRRFVQAVDELARVIGVCGAYAELDEAGRQKCLTAGLPGDAAAKLNAATLSDETRETLNLFRLIHRVVPAMGVDVLGTLIISMTHQPSDVLAAMWLSRVGAAAENDSRDYVRLPIVPLFETIDDLQRAATILDDLLNIEPYRIHLRESGNVQVCMVGYSDSAKDGGYLAANWGLNTAQQQIAETAARHGCELMVFHGRGGSLGRGGGPAARGILSLPPNSVGAKIRITEQGEVLAERYDDAQIAYRHLEQVTWATMLVSATPPAEPAPEWSKLMEQASQASFEAYRALVGDDGFVTYFSEATPIEGIETMPIASRPSRRRGRTSLADLRAIPYTFAWTQSRHMLTAFYGLGSALRPMLGEHGDTFRQMYREWPFFTAVIDNAELALAKSDMFIVREYAKLVEDANVGRRIYEAVRQEHEQATEAVLAITGREQLLEGISWLQRSIEARNPYVDPLNLIQIELMRRLRKLPESGNNERQTLTELLRLTIQGVAAGMRTTG